MNIYVGNLSFDVTEGELKELFAPFGQVTEVRLIMDKFSGKSKGLGFIEMPSKEEAEKAIEGLNGKDIKGRAVTVKEVDMERSKDDVKKQLTESINDYKEFGGWGYLKSGQWLWQIIQKSFANYWENANVEYFETKYGTKDKANLSKKLIAVTAKNAAILGGVTGAAISADEITAIVTAGGGGVGLPANIAIAASAIGGEAILLIRFQLQLVANLGKLYGVPLDPNDPEDILTILAFALGGSAADAAGKFGMKVGGKLAGQGVKTVFKKETLAAFKRIAAKVGVKVLQRSIVKYTIPIASIGIGVGWNYASTKAVGKIAIKHFKQRADEVGNV